MVSQVPKWESASSKYVGWCVQEICPSDGYYQSAALCDKWRSGGRTRPRVDHKGIVWCISAEKRQLQQQQCMIIVGIMKWIFDDHSVYSNVAFICLCFQDQVNP